VPSKKPQSLSPLEVEIKRWVRDLSGDIVRTKIMALDYVLDGGIRTGRILEIFGPEQSGKTTVMLHIAKAFLESRKGRVVYIDTEHALDERWAKLNGLDLSDERVVLIQPSSTNEALTIAERLCRYPEVSLIVLDSLPALALEEELQAEDYHSVQPGLLARAFNRTLRILTSALPQNQSVFVFSNQLRSSMSPYGAAETTPGGRMKNYSASYRLEIRKKDWIGTKQNATGIVSTIRAVKNKCGQPYRSAEVFITSQGLDLARSNFEMLVMLGLIQRNGSYYTLNGKSMRKEDLTAYMLEHADELYAKFLEALEAMNREGVEGDTQEIAEDQE